MPIKKTQLYTSLWQSCDALRGGMDASQYKDYILVLLFVKYISDKYAGQPDALIEVPPGGSFSDMVALKGKKDIGDQINKIIGRLAVANDLKGVIDVADFNNPDKLGRGQEMVDRLSKLIAIFERPELNFSKNRVEGDDLLGDAYEYLMRNFATQSGKSKGQFLTPAEVSIVLSKIIGIEKSTSRSQTLYDPTCGTGSLLLKAAAEAPHGITIYGQEMDNATAALAKMNMILHDNPAAEIWQDNTLASPRWPARDGGLKTFDFAVANVPFSTKAWSTGLDPLNDPYGRFADGIPPEKNGDYAFLQHMLRSLKSSGKGAIILPHGVLFRGNVEGEIRRNLVRKGYIKGIIGLPANLFYGTGIPACIIVLDKENAAARSGIFMLDASQGYMKDGNKNRLRHQDIHKIVDVFTRCLELPRYARMIGTAEIEANDYNLNIPRYIDSSQPEDLQDIAAHLQGGIPDRDIDALDAYWQVFPGLKAQLFEPAGRPAYSRPKVEAAQVKAVIAARPEFAAYARSVHAAFDGWKNANRPLLLEINSATRSKSLIAAISETLLAAFIPLPLIDAYDVYQHLMTYWVEGMQDDVYMLITGGWQATPDLIPPPLIIQRYFAADQAAIDELDAARDAAARQMEEMVEEYGGDDDGDGDGDVQTQNFASLPPASLQNARSDKGKITRPSLVARLKKIETDPLALAETRLLNRYLTLLDQEAEAARDLKTARQALAERVDAHYARLSLEEVQTLLVDDKWLAALQGAVQGELERVSQTLAGRIRQLAERYTDPLPALDAEVETLSARVDAHLERMGFTWH